MKLPIFRASSLERLIKCPASGALPQVDEESGEYAEAGTAGHRFLELINNGADPEDALEEIPNEYRAMCRRIDLSKIPFQNEAAEVPLHYNSATRCGVGSGVTRAPEYSVTGTADRVQFTTADQRLVVTDWKFGRPEFTTPAKDNIQLRFYALAATLSASLVVGEVVVQLGFIDQETGRVHYDSHTVTSDELSALMNDIELSLAHRMSTAKIMKGGVEPSVTEGKHCHFCPARRACPAKVALIKQFSAGLILRHHGEVTAEKTGEAWVKVQTIKKAIADFEKQISQWVRTNGDVPLPNGKTLGLIKRKGNEVLDPHIGLSALAKKVGLDKATGALKMTLTKKAILDAVKAEGLSNSEANSVVEATREEGGASRKKDSDRIGEF